MAPRVRILLLNWNNASDTIECLESVVKLDYPDFDVVLCDNGSTDGSVDEIIAWARRTLPSHPVPVVRYDAPTAEAGGRRDDDASPLKVVHTGGNLGFAGGNNVGLRYAMASGDGEFVWLLNNDMVVAPSCLTRLVERASRDARIAAVGGTLLEYYAPDEIQLVAGGNVSPWHGMTTLIGQGRPASAPREEPPRLDFISGGCMLVRVSVLAQVGLLDEKRFFMYGEDADWCFRMRARGFSLAYAPLAEVWHKGAGSSVAGSPAHEYQNVKSPLLLIHKHHPARLPVAAAYSLYRCMAPKIVRFEGRRLLAVLRAYRDLMGEFLGAASYVSPSSKR